MATRIENTKAEMGARARRTAAMGTWKCPGPVHTSVPVETTPVRTTVHLKYLCVYLSWGQYSVTGMGNGVLAGRFRVRIPPEATFVSPKYPHKLCANPDSHSVGTGFLLRGVKLPGYAGDHSPPSSAEVKNEWSYTPIPPICLQGVDRDNFTFYSFFTTF